MSLIPRDSIFDFNRLFDDFFVPSTQANRGGGDSFLSPAVDVVERDNGYTLKLDLPGVKKEDVSVQLQDGVLTIEASHNDEHTEEQDGKVIRRERRTGRFARSFAVGREVSDADISAKFTDGVLEVTVPKVTERVLQNNRIEIQ